MWWDTFTLLHKFLHARSAFTCLRVCVCVSMSGLMIDEGLHSRNLFALPLRTEEAKWGSVCIFYSRKGVKKATSPPSLHPSSHSSPHPSIHPSQPKRRRRIKGAQGKRVHSLPKKHCGEKSKCLAKHLLSERIKPIPTWPPDQAHLIGCTGREGGRIRQHRLMSV